MRGKAAYGTSERVAVLIVTSLVALHVIVVLVWGEMRLRKRRASRNIVPLPTEPARASGNGNHEPESEVQRTYSDADGADHGT